MLRKVYECEIPQISIDTSNKKSADFTTVSNGIPSIISTYNSVGSNRTREDTKEHWKDIDRECIEVEYRYILDHCVLCTICAHIVHGDRYLKLSLLGYAMS